MFKLWKWLFNPDWFTLHLGGGGGGGSSAPASQTQIADLPEWAKPYAKETLGKAAALTDISQNPYQVYSKDRIAGFDPMQEQAMRTASSPEEFGKQVQGYMSPYMQNVVDVQKREAMRSAGILGAQQQARATGAGAFGGYREGIQRAEDNRNLMRQMGDIQAMGSQRAFEQGSEEARRAQGLQMQYGAMRQGLEQQKLTQGYQDFLNQQKYPYQQLEFMSNILRGTPMGSVQTLYQPPPNVLGQLAGLGVGLGAMTGFGRGFAEGGQVDEYADGGSVTSDYFVDDALDKLSDAQLEQSKLAALSRGDRQQVAMIDDVIAERASLRVGLGNAFDSLPAEDQERVFTAADGGIVAFANGGDSSYDTLERKRLAQPRPPTRARSAPQRQVSPAVHQGINQIAEQAGLPREAVEDRYARILKDIESKDAGDIKAIQDMVEKSTGGSREVKEGALGRALAEYGFQVAREASKPGATLLGSFSGAAPTLSASMAESAKLAREMDQNDMKLRTAQRQFELSRRADNRKEASMFANQIEQLERQQEMLVLKRQELAQTGAYQQGSLANQRAQIARGAESDRLRGLSAAANLQRAQASILEVGRKAGLDFDNSRAARDLMKRLTEQHGADKAKYFYAQERRAYINEATQGARAQAESDVQARSVFDLLARE